jgi:hypothetical protein
MANVLVSWTDRWLIANMYYRTGLRFAAADGEFDRPI